MKSTSHKIYHLIHFQLHSSVQFSGINYIHIVIKQVSRTFSSHKTPFRQLDFQHEQEGSWNLTLHQRKINIS